MFEKTLDDVLTLVAGTLLCDLMDCRVFKYVFVRDRFYHYEDNGWRIMEFGNDEACFVVSFYVVKEQFPYGPIGARRLREALLVPLRLIENELCRQNLPVFRSNCELTAYTVERLRQHVPVWWFRFAFVVEHCGHSVLSHSR
jgi:hypothetical protein